MELVAPGADSLGRRGVTSCTVPHPQPSHARSRGRDASLHIERVLEFLLLRLLRDHPDGLEAGLVYRLLEQQYQLPAEWYKLIPTKGPVYAKLKADGVDWQALSSRELAALVPTEPKWRNRLRYVVRHLRDRNWLDRHPRGVWRLSLSGAEAAAQVDDIQPELLPIVRSQVELSREQERLMASGAGRRHVLRAILERRGQPSFRLALIEAYGGRCAVTGCDAVEALEAAHIIPAAQGGASEPWNGLLLRSDIHTLYDLHLLGLEPDTKIVHLSRRLEYTNYSELAGCSLRSPENVTAAPALEALRIRWAEYRSTNG